MSNYHLKPSDQPSPSSNELLDPDSHIQAEESKLPLSDETRIKQLHAKIVSHARKATELARNAGEILTRLKENTKHGAWEEYLKSTLGILPRTASNYMRLWKETKEFDDFESYLKSENLSDLGVRGTLDHLAKTNKTTTSSAKAAIVEEERKLKKKTVSQITLADGSLLDTRNLKSGSGLIGERELEDLLSTESATDPRHQAKVQRVSASLAMALKNALGSRMDSTALEVAEEAISSLLSWVQTKKNESNKA